MTDTIDYSNDRISRAEHVQRLRADMRKNIGDTASQVGTLADVSAINIDNLAIDLLAVEASEDSSYKQQRIKLYEQLNGDGSWASTVTLAQKWFDGRIAGEIKTPPDIKSMDTVFADVIRRASGAAQVLANYNE